MEPFIELTAVAAILLEANINTDDILPSVWVLNADTDLGQKLFANRRYDANGHETNFILNRDPFRQARILIAGVNFGCGSSREAAVWALKRFGISCLIAPSFGDIFYENCFMNGILAIQVDAPTAHRIAAALQATTKYVMKVDLRNCILQVGDTPPYRFSVAAERREALLGGLDSYAQMLRWKSDIGTFEARDALERPWVYDCPLHTKAQTRK